MTSFEESTAMGQCAVAECVKFMTRNCLPPSTLHTCCRYTKFCPPQEHPREPKFDAPNAMEKVASLNSIA